LRIGITSLLPTYPAFGQSEAPPPSDFSTTFDHVAEVIDKLTDQLGLHSCVLYLNDYGGPIGFRLAVRHPERVKAMVIQNAVTSDEGLGPAWEVRRAFWKDRMAYEDKIRPDLTSFEGARVRHVGSSPHPELLYR
jgi:pimeloyl-ACP methyl ester carboxylesterase